MQICFSNGHFGTDVNEFVVFRLLLGRHFY
jgi:hypothetical protein